MRDTQAPQVQKADSWVKHGFLTMQKVSAPNPCIIKGSVACIPHFHTFTDPTMFGVLKGPSAVSYKF